MAATAMLAASLAAYADTVSTFAASNVAYENGATVTGNVDIDVTTGVVASGSFTYTNQSASKVFATLATYVNGFDGGTQSYFELTDVAGDDIVFGAPVASFLGYMGSSLCTTHAICNGYVSTMNPANGSMFLREECGSLIFVSSITTATTPEPSSFALLGTGLLGVAGVVKRRFA